jgi:hypothetical protein
MRTTCNLLKYLTSYFCTKRTSTVSTEQHTADSANRISESTEFSSSRLTDDCVL